METFKGGKIDCAYDELVEIGSLVPNPKNNNRHPPEQIKRLSEIIHFQGQRSPIVVSRRSGFIIKGHARLEAIRALGWKQCAVDYQDYVDEAQEYADMTADNAIALWAELDLGQINAELPNFGPELNIELLGIQNFTLEVPGENPQAGSSANGALAERFLAPPFSVLDCRQGYWQDRKRFWIEQVRIKSEVGRGENLLKFSDQVTLKKKNKANAFDTAGNIAKKNRGFDEEYEGGDAFAGSGTSIFDPVLCEIAYSWFCPKDGIVIDPFAGGSVRGVVASRLDRKYIGIDLRQEQIEANNTQLDICGDGPAPTWIHGDSTNIDKLCEGIKADMIFSCPPYADLEVYSDDPKDLSTMPYEDFKKAYFEIIKKSCALLKEDSFAMFCVREVRSPDKNGSYYNFVGDTIKAFQDAGLEYYNEIILVTSLGTLPLRVGRMFKSGRKIGKTHQNVLVFIKGNSRKATEKVGEVEIMEVEAEGQEQTEN